MRHTSKTAARAMEILLPLLIALHQTASGGVDPRVKMSQVLGGSRVISTGIISCSLESSDLHVVNHDTVLHWNKPWAAASRISMNTGSNHRAAADTKKG